MISAPTGLTPKPRKNQMDKRALKKKIRDTGTILYLVLTDDGYKLYPEMGTAYHAAQQLGPDAIPLSMPLYYDAAKEITVEDMKRHNNWYRKYRKT